MIFIIIMDNNKHMYDAWFDDILDDVRDNVLGEYWSKYLNYTYYREILKDLLHRSKLVHNHKYPSRSSVLHFNYGRGYELESPSNSVNYIEKYEVPENELNELHHVYYFILNQIVKTQGEEENMLTESNDIVKKFLDKVVDRLLKESMYRLWEDKNKLSSDLKKIRVEIIFALNNTWTEDPIEFFSMETVKSSALRRKKRKKEYLEDYEVDQLTSIYGLNSEEMEEVVFNYYTTLYKNIYKSYLEMNEDDTVPTSKPEEWFRGDEVFDIGGSLNESLSSEVNKKVDKLFKDDSTLKGEENIKNKFKKLFGMDDWVADHAMVLYLSKQQSLTESTEKPKGFNLKYLFKVVDSIMKEIEIDDDYGLSGVKVRGYGPWNDHSTGHYAFWTGLEKHAKDTYGLTQAETEMVSGLIWDSLNSKNMYISSYIHSDERHKKHFGSLREQHYEDWEERYIEQNKKKFRDKGITVLSTDSNIPFYKRIDSKEIRFLNKVADMLAKETKLEEADDIFDFIVYAPFGNYELKVLLNEYRHYGFEKYVNNIYGVGDNQIIFPTGDNIAQASEGQFLWEMYKDKLRRKQIQMVNPGFDIPDDAIIIENDFSKEQIKSLLRSFGEMDTPEEIASEELGNMIKWVKDLPEELFLYRVLYIDDVNDINYDELGSHYSQDRTDLINNHYDRGSIYGDMGEHAYLITVKVPKSEVDVMETLNNNILYPHEKEITLKDKGRGAQYLDVEKI